MEKDTVLFQLAALFFEQEQKIESIKRMKTNQEHKSALIADVRKRLTALDFAIAAVKGGK